MGKREECKEEAVDLKGADGSVGDWKRVNGGETDWVSER